MDGFKFYARKISEIHTTAINASEHDRCVGMIPLRTLAFFHIKTEKGDTMRIVKSFRA